MNTNQQRLSNFPNLKNDVSILVRDESDEFDTDYEVIESSVLISFAPDWYAEQAQETLRALNFDIHLAVCEVEIKNGISSSFEPIPPSEPLPDMTIYNFNAILDSF